MIKFIFLRKNIFLSAVVFSLFQLTTFSLAQAGANNNDMDTWYISGAFGMALDAKIDFQVTDSPLNREGTVHLRGDNPNFRFTIGRKIDNIRIEGEFFWLPYQITDAEYSAADQVPVSLLNQTRKISGSIDGRGIIANIYYDWENGTKWVPYVGFGVGLMEVDLDSKVELLGNIGQGKGSDTTTVIQSKFGITNKVSDHMDLFGEYTLLHVGETDIDLESGGTITSDEGMTNHMFVGVRYKFGGSN